MAGKEQEGDEEHHEIKNSPTNWRESIEERYVKIRQHAEEYPYVWASYIVVYGGLALWTGYRWRKLRKTENRVRALQERLRKLVEAEESASSSSSVASIDKTPTDKSHK